MKKLGLLIVILLISFSIVKSADIEEKAKEKIEWPKNRIGLTGSTFTGYGLTYYRHFGEKFTAKICLFAFGENRNDEYDQSSNFQSIVGTELQYTLHQTKYTRLHIFTSFSFWYDENDYGQYQNQSLSIDRMYTPGIGFGFEFLAWGRISFNLETGIQARYEVNSNYYVNSSKTNYPKSYGFGIGGGISYAF